MRKGSSVSSQKGYTFMNKLILALIFLTGCTNQSLLVRCQQLEGQRDKASQELQVCHEKNKILVDYLGACVILYGECQEKIVTH